MPNLLSKFENNKVFTEDEGWMLFKLAAFAEAAGWTLLILGIFLTRYVFPGNQIPVQIAGHIHGFLFMLYALAAVGLYPTIRLPRKFALLALLASVPPYGSVLFEQWAVRRKRKFEFKNYSHCILLRTLNGEL